MLFWCKFVTQVKVRFQTQCVRFRKKVKQSQDAVCSVREYGIGAQILCDHGLRNIILRSDTNIEIAALDGYDLRIVVQCPLEGQGVGT